MAKNNCFITQLVLLKKQVAAREVAATAVKPMAEWTTEAAESEGGLGMPKLKLSFCMVGTKMQKKNLWRKRQKHRSLLMFTRLAAMRQRRKKRMLMGEQPAPRRAAAEDSTTSSVIVPFA